MRLICNLGAWIKRKHGKTDYFLTQLLIGNGGFQSYLDKIGKARSSDCLFFGVADDAHKKFFLWKAEWNSSPLKYRDLSPDNIVENCQNRTAFHSIAAKAAS